jgi:hypothetical protein
MVGVSIVHKLSQTFISRSLVAYAVVDIFESLYDLRFIRRFHSELAI